jgi:hypothetical protein
MEGYGHSLWYLVFGHDEFRIKLAFGLLGNG